MGPIPNLKPIPPSILNVGFYVDIGDSTEGIADICLCRFNNLVVLEDFFIESLLFSIDNDRFAVIDSRFLGNSKCDSEYVQREASEQKENPFVFDEKFTTALQIYAGHLLEIMLYLIKRKEPKRPNHKELSASVKKYLSLYLDRATRYGACMGSRRGRGIEI